MMILYWILCILCIGSFLQLKLMRLLDEKSKHQKRSYCVHCHKILKWYELIPIFSYLKQKGRCRYCHGKIAFEIFIQECYSLLIGYISIVYAKDIVSLCSYLVFSFLMWWIAYYDLKTLQIQNRCVCLCFLLGVLTFVKDPTTLLSRCFAMCFVSVPMWLCNHFYKEAFGGGDIKLCAALGFLFQTEAMWYIIHLSFLIGGMHAMYLLSTKKAKRQQWIAFGPYLCSMSFLIYSLQYVQ